jgi:signal peptidase I
MKLVEKKPTTKQIVKFAITSIIYILWIIWMRSYWMLIGLAVIFDIYISKKVKWNPLRQKKGEPKKKWKEWADALIFALVVSSIIKIFIFQLYAIPTGSLEKTLLIGDRLFVSKLSYGPKMPMTPISFPLVHNKLPFSESTSSYLDWIQWDYKRLAGFGNIERDDIVVFNFPVGDTILVGYENPDYYQHLREKGRPFVEQNFEIKVRPLDKKENFVKRCVALPGDTLTIIDTKVHINGKPQKDYKGIEFNYTVKNGGEMINSKALERLGLNSDDHTRMPGVGYMLNLTNEKAKKVKSFPSVTSVEKYYEKKGVIGRGIFPHDTTFKWNQDNFGPLVIPKRGMTIDLTCENIILYRRVIDVYEYNDYEEKDGKIYINGTQVDKYTFKQNYYWMMGDNRHNSADSRAWGFVPEDHIVGKPVLIFYSLDEEKDFPSNIRWDRIFKVVRKE